MNWARENCMMNWGRFHCIEVETWWSSVRGCVCGFFVLFCLFICFEDPVVLDYTFSDSNVSVLVCQNVGHRCSSAMRMRGTVVKTLSECRI